MKFLINYFLSNHEDLGLTMSAGQLTTKEHAEAEEREWTDCDKSKGFDFSGYDYWLLPVGEGEILPVESDLDLVEFVSLPASAGLIAKYVKARAVDTYGIELGDDAAIEIADSYCEHEHCSFLIDPFSLQEAKDILKDHGLLSGLPIERFKRLQQRLNVGNSETAKILGVTARAVQYWRAGEKPIPQMAFNFLEYILANK